MIRKRSKKLDEKGYIFEDPYKSQVINFKMVPIDKLTVVAHQRKPSQYHVKHLIQSIERIGFIIPVVAVALNDTYMIIDGQHRFLAAKELGIKELPVLIVPNELASLMMNFNIEKELNIREKSHVAIAIYRQHLEATPEKLETDPEIVDSIENAYYVTCGIAYEKKEKFSGSTFESLLKKSDFFLDLSLKEAFEEREKRAEKLGMAYDLIREIAQELKERGKWHPYIYQQIMSYANPYKRKRLPVDFNEIFDEVINTLQEAKAKPELVLKAELSESFEE